MNNKQPLLQRNPSLYQIKVMVTSQDELNKSDLMLIMPTINHILSELKLRMGTKKSSVKKVAQKKT